MIYALTQPEQELLRFLNHATHARPIRQRVINDPIAPSPHVVRKRWFVDPLGHYKHVLRRRAIHDTKSRMFMMFQATDLKTWMAGSAEKLRQSGRHIGPVKKPS